MTDLTMIDNDLGELLRVLGFKLRRELGDAPEVVRHIRTQVVPSLGGNGSGMRVSGSKEPPLPFRETAVDDANEVYAALVMWVAEWSRALDVQPPSTVLVAWYRFNWAGNAEAIGLPGEATPEGAHGLTQIMVTWLLLHHDRILQDDLAWDYCQELLPLLHEKRARYKWEPEAVSAAEALRRVARGDRLRPADPRECPICHEHAVRASWYTADAGDLNLTCAECGAPREELLAVLGLSDAKVSKVLDWLVSRVEAPAEEVPFDPANPAHQALARRAGRLDLI